MSVVAGGFPWGDWQFWVATAIAVLAALWLIRRSLPRRARRNSGKRVQLTAGGKAVARR